MYAALEKDICNFMQWHIRSDGHKTNCMKKVISTLKEEIDNRTELLEYYEK
jgi:uncharacterized protein (UPF0335 family)